jgi:AcrR family transcriptional regulator
MGKGEASRHRILCTGLDLASERGLSNVTLGELSTRAAMSKSGLFAHFKSKDDLQIKLLEAAEVALVEHVLAPCAALPAGVPQLRCAVDRWFVWAQSAGLRGGCPLYAAAFELDDVPGPVREYLLQRHEVWIGILIGLLDDAVVEGQLSTDTDTAQVAFELEGIYLSHHLARRFTGDPDALQRAARAVDALLARHTPTDPEDPT